MKKLLGAVLALGISTAAVAGGNMKKDIVDTAVSAGTFETLVTAVKAADLVDTLKSDGPFTVFAPSDAAFAALPKGTLDNLLQPENKDQLIKLLTYHVVAGKVTSGDIKDPAVELKTLLGPSLEVQIGSDVVVDQAVVSQPDIEASNGVVHVIDNVMLPDNWPDS